MTYRARVWPIMLIVLMLLITTESVAPWGSLSNPLKSVWTNWFLVPGDRQCPGCSRNSLLQQLNEPTIADLRVEYVKQQILMKLRLEKPPEVSISVSTLPKPLVNGNVLELKPGKEPLEPENKPTESFYAKTDQLVVFPLEGAPEEKACLHKPGCFSFSLPNEMQFVGVTGAELWFYKDENKNESNQTLVIFELELQHAGQIISIFQSGIEEGWLKVDVSSTIKKWLSQEIKNHTIKISGPVSMDSTLKPFLVIQTSPLPQRYRLKRNSNCQPEMKECCRDQLYISFEDIGWNDWILHPSGYHAYFCRGTCSNPVSLTNTGSHHNDVIMRWLARSKANTRRNEIVPCCSPTQLSPIQLLYIDSNNTITQKTLPNMIVEACGCM